MVLCWHQEWFWGRVCGRVAQKRKGEASGAVEGERGCRWSLARSRSQHRAAAELSVGLGGSCPSLGAHGDGDELQRGGRVWGRFLQEVGSIARWAFNAPAVKAEIIGGAEMLRKGNGGCLAWGGGSGFVCRGAAANSSVGAEEANRGQQTSSLCPPASIDPRLTQTRRLLPTENHQPPPLASRDARSGPAFSSCN